MHESCRSWDPAKYVFLFALSLCFIPGTISAQWQPDGVPVCTISGPQSIPVAVPDGTGGAIIAWTDGRHDLLWYDIYAQRVDASGNALWTSNGIVLCNATERQDNVAIASDGSGGAIVAWTDRRNGSSHLMYAQRIDGAGTSLWTSNGLQVLTQPSARVQVVSDGAGGAIFTGSYVGTTSDVWAQRVDGSGDLLWTDAGTVICAASGEQFLWTMTDDGAEGVIAIWGDKRVSELLPPHLYAQRVNAAGNTLWPLDGVPVAAGGQRQEHPSATSDGSGGVIVAWQGSVGFLTAQHLDSAGIKLWGNFGKAISDFGTVHAWPSVASDLAGGAVISFLAADANGPSIWCQRLNGAGTRLWSPNGVLMCSPDSMVANPKTCPDGAGGAVVTWQDNRGPGGGSSLFAQRADGDGNLRWADQGVPVCSTPTASHVAISDGDYGTIVAWKDGRSDYYGDI